MNWIILVIAALFEVGFASCLGKAKETTGTESYWWYGGFIACLTISMALLIKATQTLPIGTAYAVWTGLGAVGTVLMGIFCFQRSGWLLAFILPVYSGKLYCRTKSCISLNTFRIFILFFYIRLFMSLLFREAFLGS